MTKLKPDRQPRVLLVEDSLPVRQRLRSLIEETGPIEIVGECGTVAGARALFDEHRPDAVVMDLHLADGSGYDLLGEFKEVHPASVLIVLTCFTTAAFRTRCVDLGADHFFEKSTEFERVSKVLINLREHGI